jgi:hypothetical protein
MTLTGLLVYFAAGRLLTWLLQTSGLTRRLWAINGFWAELGECDLCLGFWVYLLLALLWQPPLFGLWPWPVEMVIFAAVASFVMHLIRLGWHSKFSAVIIE